MGSRDPGLYVWLREEVLEHFLALKLMLSKNPKGLEGSIKCVEPTPHSRRSFASELQIVHITGSGWLVCVPKLLRRRRGEV